MQLRFDWSSWKRQFGFELRRVLAFHPRVIAKKIALKNLGVAVYLLLLPVTLILHLAGYRRVDLFLDRIGHLAIEPDCLLKEQALGQIRRRKWILLAPTHRVANPHLLSYWAPHFIIFRNPMLCFLLQSAARWGLCFHDASRYMRAIGRTQAAYRIYRDWGARSPLVTLSSDDIDWGRRQLTALGLPENAWFVCLHVREAGFSPVDEELHRHRNADIANTYLAIEDIVRRGGWVIRLGDPTMTKMRAMPCTIDYAHHPLRSARLDIYLCARSRFILGNTSGIALVGTIFGVPSALANMVPMTAMGYGPNDISIPKLFWSDLGRRYVGLRELIDQGLGSAQFYAQFVEARLRAEENSPEDILDLSSEMFDELQTPGAIDPQGRTLQAQFTGCFREGDYAYLTASRVGARFLLKHGQALGLE